MKQQKWSSLAEHVANRHDLCVHGELDGERQWLREGNTFKIIKINLYKTISNVLSPVFLLF